MSATAVIHVTAEHIAQGETGEPSSCAVALAVGEQFPAATDCVMVTDDAIEVDMGWYADLPDEAICFIKAFDDSEPVEPFSFEVEWKRNEDDDLEMTA